MDVTLSSEPQLPESAASTDVQSGGEKRPMSGLSFSRPDTGKEVRDLATLNSGSAAETGSPSRKISMSQGTSSPALYQVSLNMVCTTGQLSSLMVGLADAGTCVSMKVDPQ